VHESVCRGVADTPKSGHDRLVPLVDELRAALEALPKHDRERDKPVALHTRGGAWGEFGLNLALKRACAKADLDARWRFHDLRHYFVTTLFRGGAPAPTVQELAGHEHLATTQRYAHVVAVDRVDAIRRLGAAVGATRGQRPPEGG
jgi:site-specific recombinase XerD